MHRRKPKGWSCHSDNVRLPSQKLLYFEPGRVAAAFNRTRFGIGHQLTPDAAAAEIESQWPGMDLGALSAFSFGTRKPSSPAFREKPIADGWLSNISGYASIGTADIAIAEFALLIAAAICFEGGFVVDPAKPDTTLTKVSGKIDRVFVDLHHSAVRTSPSPITARHITWTAVASVTYALTF
jgi:hypothetical protein